MHKNCANMRAAIFAALVVFSMALYAAQLKPKRGANSTHSTEIQCNTFTRWVNARLKAVGLEVVDIEKEFRDGVKLAALVETLSGKKVVGIHSSPRFNTQMIENVTLVLKFLETVEGLNIVNIDSLHIVKGNLKLILGLIWLLILHYQVTASTVFGEAGANDTGNANSKQLKNWLENKLPPELRQFSNFTSDWKVSRRWGALVNSVDAGICSEWQQWDENDKLQNIAVALSSAESAFGIPQLITPSEICSDDCDEQSILTYLSLFPVCSSKVPLFPTPEPEVIEIETAVFVPPASATPPDQLSPNSTENTILEEEETSTHEGATDTNESMDDRIISITEDDEAVEEKCEIAASTKLKRLDDAMSSLSLELVENVELTNDAANDESRDTDCETDILVIDARTQPTQMTNVSALEIASENNFDFPDECAQDTSMRTEHVNCDVALTQPDTHHNGSNSDDVQSAIGDCETAKKLDEVESSALCREADSEANRNQEYSHESLYTHVYAYGPGTGWFLCLHQI